MEETCVVRGLPWIPPVSDVLTKSINMWERLHHRRRMRTLPFLAVAGWMLSLWSVSGAAEPEASRNRIIALLDDARANANEPPPSATVTQAHAHVSGERFVAPVMTASHAIALPPLPDPIEEGEYLPEVESVNTNPNFELAPVPAVEDSSQLAPEPTLAVTDDCPDCWQDEIYIDPLAEPGGPGLVAVANLETWGWNHQTGDFGLGSQQVPFALFDIDSAKPLSQLRLRFDSRYGLAFPDRSEYFWAEPELGPKLPEHSVDYQRYSVRQEIGGESFSVFTEVPLLSIDPVVNPNTTGLGDVIVGQKFLLTNAKNRKWQVAQILTTVLNTGSIHRGLGNGNTALEPGILVRRTLSETTYLHGELKYWIPLGADPKHSGEILRYGLGLSTVAYQTDCFAMMPTLEVITHTVTTGQKTTPTGEVVDVDGETFSNLLFGTRYAWGPPGDLGLFEIGVAGGFLLGNDGFDDARMTFDFRWSF
ncbi:transporter family protein [Thalassoroseus pseudoceratinae]|uniref:transporter n=1 Tax=Thalassoroseus pseudoceratinae TaxID=2713176 RepID=UPI0014232318|nr:transporter [Thalassoroseus pseudoceratinae]